MSEPASSDPLEDALGLLKDLNSLRDRSGRRLSDRVKTPEGFAPWWFQLENLFWHVLVPYAQQRSRATGTKRRASEDDQNLRHLFSHPEGFRRIVGVPGLGFVRLVLATVVFAGFSFLAAVVFRVRRQSTLLYTIDKISPGRNHDFRLTPIYQELHRRGYHFGEYVHASDPRAALRNLWQRGRWVVFLSPAWHLAWLEARLTAASLAPSDLGELPGGSSGVDGEFHRAIARRAYWLAEVSRRQVKWLRRLLRLHGVKKAVILDDSRHALALVAACKSEGIPVLGYMHGLLNRYHVGLMAKGFGGARSHAFDLYGVWSEYFLARIRQGDLYDESNSFAMGALRPPVLGRESARGPRAADAKIRVMLVSEPRADQAAVAQFLRCIVADARFSLFIKVRIGENLPHIRSALADAPDVPFVTGNSVFDALREADVVIGTYGTILYEAALVDVPAVVLNTPFTYGHDLATDGLADFASSPDTVIAALLSAHATSPEERGRRREVIWGDRSAAGARNLFDRAEDVLWPGVRSRAVAPVA